MENEKVKSLFDNVLSKTALTLISVVAAGITIFAFLQDKSVDLCYEITSNTNVLDFNADISKLEVLYDSTNLKQTKENLRIYTIKIVNLGNKDIIKEFYDSNEPIGLRINTGSIIETPELIQSSSDYLNRNAKITTHNKKKIIFSDVILEKGEFFTYKLLVLHNQDTIPEIQSFGKIAGQKVIPVKNSIDVKKEISFWNRVYGGNIWVQILRILSYLIATILVIALIVTSSEKIDDRKEKKRRIKTIKGFKQSKEYEYTRMDDAIFDRYEQLNGWIFKEMLELIGSEDELNEKYTTLKDKVKTKEFRRHKLDDEGNERYLLESDTWSTIREMIKDGIVFKDDDKLNINQAMKDTLERFVAYLEEKGEFKRRRFLSRNQMLDEEIKLNDDDE